MTDLGTLGGTDSEAHAINSSGQVVGQADVASGAPHPFLWQNGNMIDLGSLGGCCGGALAINDAGVIVGWSTTADGHDRDFIWQNGIMTELPTLGGENGSDGPNAINSFGVVVGPSYTSDTHIHPYVWQNGVMTDLGFDGRAFGVNDSSWVVGSGAAAFVWQAGVMSTLPTLSTMPPIADFANAINNAGQIVGNSAGHAVLWTVTSVTAGATPTGTNVNVAPAISGAPSTTVALTFSTVTSAGLTTLTTSPPNATPPSGFQLGSPATYYNLTTTASFAGAITVCINYAGTTFANPDEIRLFHGNGSGGWTDVTTSLNESTTTICGSVASLSPFIVAEPVPFSWSGFFSPVSNPPVLNLAKAGSSIPMKFSLAGNQGLNIFASGTPTIAPITCGASSTVSIGDASTAGGSGLHYDAATNQYTYVWKTSKSWADSCLQLLIRLTDGTTHAANFKFTR
jgi:probable HAF family extracellular repeat protein